MRMMFLRRTAVAVLLLGVLQASEALVQEGTQAAKIVAVFTPVTSHWLQFEPILDELVARGHHVKVSERSAVIFV